MANLLAAARLVHDIVTNNKLYASNAAGLLATGGVIWATNVIAFGLWYWDLDRGGAASRAHQPQANPAFVLTAAARTPLDVVVRLADRRLQRLDHRVVVGLVEVDQRDQVLIWRLTSACGSTRCRLDFR